MHSRWIAVVVITMVLACGASAAEPDYSQFLKQVQPAEVIEVKGESLRLSPDKPTVWARGTPLRQVQTLGPGAGIPSNGALEGASIVLRHGDKVLARDKDYLLDELWGMLGIGPASSVTVSDEVKAEYRYSLKRVDSIVRTADGKQLLRKGQSQLTIPQPPELKPGETLLANVFVDYFSKGTDAVIFPVLETAEQARTLTTPGRIPRAMERIKSGKPLKIVCWGDSVTEGGDASTPDKAYPKVLERRLREKFPSANITVEAIAVGGSNSHQWLYPDKHPFPGREKDCKWQRIADAKPDVVTLEFVNDAGLSPEQVAAGYADIFQRVKAIGAELVLITPHYVMPSWMGFKDLRGVEARPYVLALRRFSKEQGYALADASSRWEHLWKEGLPYTTLLRNGINHPDDRGHALFADEIVKCFE